MPHVWYVHLPLEFPAGVHFGAGKRFNSLSVARDGRGRPVLNGTSLAGLLRHLWSRHLNRTTKAPVDFAADRLFGSAYDDRQGRAESSGAVVDRQSAVKFTNYPIQIEIGTSDRASRAERDTIEWTYHQRNRHRGTVMDQALFSIESCPPGSTVDVGFWIDDSLERDIASEEVEEFIAMVVKAFNDGLHCGGNSNRGMGLARIRHNECDQVKFKKYDLCDLEQHAALLDAQRAWRKGQIPSGLDDYKRTDTAVKNADKTFACRVRLRIPTGQDMLVGGGAGDDVQIDMQRVVGASGQNLWRLPGSSLRGLFRSWMTRLAARETIKLDLARQPGSPEPKINYPSPDDAASYATRVTEKQFQPDLLGWCGIPRDQRENQQLPEHWTIPDLFGSCFARGRIKISDGYAVCSDADVEKCPEAQRRMHVAVDRITGGAAHGLLFDNRVLTSNLSGQFEIEIQIADAREHELRWLAQTMAALHVGLLRIGSSKASGRLEISGLEFLIAADEHRAVFRREWLETELQNITGF